jgi:hypothetical protein
MLMGIVYRAGSKLQEKRHLSKRDILDAFIIVAYEIRTTCNRFASEGITQADACTGGTLSHFDG